MGASCSQELPALKVVDKVDVERFTGDWYVVGCKPTPFETQPHNALERYAPHYKKGKDGKEALDYIDVDFTYNKKSFDGPSSTIRQYLYPNFKEGNGAWKAQPRICGIPLLKMDYLILDVDADYSYTVVGVPDRKYVWVMSRAKTMDAAKLEELKDDLVKKHQYDMKGFIEVPNQ